MLDEIYGANNAYEFGLFRLWIQKIRFFVQDLG